MKNILVAMAFAAVCFGAWAANKAQAELPSNDAVILHAWSWSFNTIRENMADIAKAGYTYVQTSPAQECVTEVRGDKGGGNQLFGKGKWYYYYQPTDWKIGNYALGSRDEFIAMCAEAKKYGVRVIVDVLPNHTAVDDTRVSDALDAAVGGHENLYHAAGFTPITDYNDRLQCTTGEMGGLPDVNTENPDFQHYYMTYVNDLIACGARGFRYDTAKHIGLPSDPLDPKSKENDFWLVATGRKAVKGLRLATPEDGLFIYGEVLQDKNVKEREYGEYMDLVASNYGYVIRNVLNAKNWRADDIINWQHPVAAAHIVTWVESHDTYCNEHLSAGIPCEKVRQAFAFLTARQFGTPLFYSRPNNSSPENVWGDNLIGARGNDEFKHPEIAAAIAFRKAMRGQGEMVYYNDNGAVVEVCRGKKGALLANISDSEVKVEMATDLPNGSYTDAVHGVKFTVKKGMLKGVLAANSSYALIKK